MKMYRVVPQTSYDGIKSKNVINAFKSVSTYNLPLSTLSCSLGVLNVLIFPGVLTLYEGQGGSSARKLMFEAKLSNSTDLLKKQMTVYKAEESTLKVNRGIIYFCINLFHSLCKISLDWTL